MIRDYGHENGQLEVTIEAPSEVEITFACERRSCCRGNAGLHSCRCGKLLSLSDISMTDEIGFSILKYSGKTPVVAVCVCCRLKFFTPSELLRDSQRAGDYLWEKYRDHRCATATALEKDGTRDSLSAVEIDTTRKQRPGAI